MHFLRRLQSVFLKGGLVYFCLAWNGLGVVIPNQLNHTWPGELVSFDEKQLNLPKGDLALEVQGKIRPAQRLNGKVWTYVTISNKDHKGKKIEIGEVQADFKQGKA